MVNELKELKELADLYTEITRTDYYLDYQCGADLGGLKDAPETVGDLSSVDIRYTPVIRNSWWEYVFGSDYNYEELCEKVGFDRCTFQVKLLEVDESLLESGRMENRNYSGWTLDDVVWPTVYTDESDFQRQLKDAFDDAALKGEPYLNWRADVKLEPALDEDPCLSIPWKTPNPRHYKAIKIEFSKYFKLNIRVGSNPGVNDFCLLEVFAEPETQMHMRPGQKGSAMPKGVLGNLNNYSCEGLQGRIKGYCPGKPKDGLLAKFNAKPVPIGGFIDEALKQVGIKIDLDHIMLHSVELNLTFEMPYPFEVVRRAIKCYEGSLPRNYTVNQNAKDTTSKTGKGKNGAPTELSVQNKSSITAKFYNKGVETEKEDNKNGGGKSLYMLEHNYSRNCCLCRVEFTLKKANVLKRYFGSLNLMELTQDDLDNAFLALVERMYVEPYKKFCQKRTEYLKEYVSKLDTGRSSKWRSKFTNDLMDNCPIIDEKYRGFLPEGVPLVWDVDIDFTDEVLDCNPTFSRHKSRYRREIKKLFEMSDVYKENKILYSVLADFFMRVLFRGGLSENRRVGYISVKSFENAKLDAVKFAREVNRSSESLPVDKILSKKAERTPWVCQSVVLDKPIDLEDPVIKEIAAPLVKIGMDKWQIMRYFNTVIQ